MRRLTAIGGLAAVALATLLVPATANAASTPIGGGAHIAFVRGGNIFIANANGAGVKQLTKGGKDSQPALFVNEIAFTRSGWIWTMDLTGKSPRRWFPGHGASFPLDGYSITGTDPFATDNPVTYIAPVTLSNGCPGEAVAARDLSAGSVPQIVQEHPLNGCGEPGNVESFGPTTSWVGNDYVDQDALVYSVSINDSSPGPTVTFETDIRSATEDWGDPASLSITTTAKLPYDSPPAVSAFVTSRSGAGYVAFTSTSISGSRRLYEVPLDDPSDMTPYQVAPDANPYTPTFSPDGAYLLWADKTNTGYSIKRKTVCSAGSLGPKCTPSSKITTLLAKGGLSPSWG